MKESPELRLGNLAAYGVACLIFMAVFYGFTPLNAVVALITALLLSIEPEGRTNERRWGIAAGIIAGITPLCFWLLEIRGPEFIMYCLAAIASALFILSHLGKEKLQSVSILFYFIVALSFIGSFGNSIEKYVELIFFTLTASITIPLLFVRVNKKMRMHRRARLEKRTHH